jgi:tetratricopeptide (TPR) repeat protein
MAKQEPLFDLVSSLSQTEKRYFKLYSSMQFAGEKKNYAQLFELIEQQTRSASGYDEAAILATLPIKYFSQLKQHLHVKIMESLRAYHAGESIDVQIQAHVHDFEILLKKSLYRQSRKALEKARKLAEKFERYTEIIRINKLETKLLRTENDVDRLDRHIQQVHAEIDAIVERITHEIAFDKAFVHIIKWNKKVEFVRNADEMQTLKAVFDAQLPDADPARLSVDARLKYFYVKGLYFFFLGDFEQSCTYFQDHLACIEANQWIINEQLPTYVRALGNYALLNLKLNRFEAFADGVQRLQNIEKQSTQIQQYADYSAYTFKLMYFTQIGQFEKAVDCIEQNTSAIKAIEERIEAQNILYTEHTYVLFKSMIAYLGVGDLRKALRILSNFLNSGNADLKQDSYCMGRIINLFIHFELGNADLLEHNLKSTYRFLNKKERLYHFETEMMNFITKALEITSPKELQAAFETLKSKIAPLAQQEFERNVFDHFDFIAWLDAKIENRPLSQIVQRKFPTNPAVQFDL